MPVATGKLQSRSNGKRKAKKKKKDNMLAARSKKKKRDRKKKSVKSQHEMYSVQSSSKRKAKQASKHSFNSLEKGKKKKERREREVRLITTSGGWCVASRHDTNAAVLPTIRYRSLPPASQKVLT